MFNDILGEKKKESRPTTEEIMDAMEYNINKKQEIIDDLLKRITELERQLEEEKTTIHITGI